MRLCPQLKFAKNLKAFKADFTSALDDGEEVGADVFFDKHKNGVFCDDISQVSVQIRLWM